MVEGSAWSGEAPNWQRLEAVLGWWSWLTFVLQCQDQDAFEPPHVDQFETKGSGTRGIESLGGVALGKAE
jgi:hypothetical protein